MNDELQKLLDLLEQLPEGLQSDWQGTNHYELTQPGPGSYWWLELGDLNMPVELRNTYAGKTFCELEVGKRVGLLLDIAAQARKVLPELKKLKDKSLTFDQTKQLLKYHAERKLTPESEALYRTFLASVEAAKATDLKAICKNFEDALMVSACSNYLDNKISTGTFESF